MSRRRKAKASTRAQDQEGESLAVTSPATDDTVGSNPTQATVEDGTRQGTTPWLSYRCTVALEGDASEDKIIVEYPGTAVRAHVRVEFLETTELAAARAKLLFRAHGSGSPETHVFVQRTLIEGEVEEGQLLETEVDLELPENAPMTYDGVYVKVDWAVAIEIIAPDGRLIVEEVPLIVRPRPVEWNEGDSYAAMELVTGNFGQDEAAEDAREHDDTLAPEDPPLDSGEYPVEDPAGETDVAPDEAAEGIRGFYDRSRVVKDVAFRPADRREKDVAAARGVQVEDRDTDEDEPAES